jgi:DUF1680 family protein
MEAMKTYGCFRPLPAGSISPRGWLEEWARVNAGSWLLDYARQHDPRVYGRFWNRSESGAVAFTDKNETVGPPDYAAYFADGLLRYAQMLPDSDLAREATVWLDCVLASQDEDGYIGAFAPGARWQNWLEVFTQTLLIEALLSRYEATAEPLLLQACERAAGSQIQAWRAGLQSAADPFGTVWEGRDATLRIIFGAHGTVTVGLMSKLYGLTGNAAYLDFARDVMATCGKVQAYLEPHPKLFFTRHEDALAGEHNVMETEHVGLPAMLYEYDGNPQLLAASRAAWDMMVRYHLSVTGTPTGDEPMLRVGPRENAEHCGAVEWIITGAALARVTGETRYADEIERAAYNAYPAARSPDGMMVAYMHTPNQLVAAEWSSSPFYTDIESCSRQHYHTAHEPLCCNANSPRGLAHFIDCLVLRADDGLVVSCYGPCVAHAALPDAGLVTLEMITRYPFEDTVILNVSPAVAASFALYLRIPGWCRAAALSVNGEPVALPVQPGAYAVLRRTWQPGDRVELRFDNSVRLIQWMRSQADFDIRAPAVVLQRGPLTFALPVKEDWRQFTAPAQAPVQVPSHVRSCRVLPAEGAAWNYALCIDPAQPPADLPLVELSVPPGSRPWEYAAVGLRVPARRVVNWRMDGEPDHPMTPGLPYKPMLLADEIETVTLVPFGCTHLRMTYLPLVS